MELAISSSLNEQALCSGLRTRTEPGGRTIVFNAARDQYLFANRQALAVIAALRDGEPLAEQYRAVANQHRVSEATAAESVVQLLLVLAGQADPESTPGDDQDLPALWTLESELGPGLERCETFGMPL